MFGGLIGGLLGGGSKTSVSQSSKSNTNVKVSVDPQIGILNQVDLEPVQKLVDHFAAAQGDVGEGLKVLGAAQLAGTAREAQTAQAIKTAWDEIKTLAVLAGVGYVAVKAYK